MQCHNPSQADLPLTGGSIALVGHPNVGKSVIFQRLTGQHVTVSNYPGTTVEVTRGSARQIGETVFVDTPGVITFPSLSEDEQVTARLLLHEPLRAILQVGDAKNLRRTLLLTIQLLEMGRPVVMALNMMDEAEAQGMAVDDRLLAQYLDIQVILTTATRGKGIEELTQALRQGQTPQFALQYDANIEAAVAQFCALLASIGQPAPTIACRAMALLWLSKDPVTEKWLEERLPAATLENLRERREGLQISFHEPLSNVIQQTRVAYVDQLASSVILSPGQGWQGISSTLCRMTTHPVWGVFILAGVLYALYWFVGIFGAGTLVGLLEENLFAGHLNPWVTGWIERLVPLPFLVDLLVGEYGLWTMGMTYALALILPIVSTFFLAFGIMEDSGYLPRLAALSNRLFQFMGLNGKAVLPMVLGLGCVTMATLTTRVLDSKRERLLVTLLLALAIPCSAQLGVVLGMLAGISLAATLIWSGVVFLILLAIGWLAARLMPGERSKLLVEMPPMRLPLFSNVLIKTLARLEWYLKEVIPLFLLGTGILFFLDKTNLLDWIVQAAQPFVVGWLGLPGETSTAFLLGFLRRDFGATGLFVMESQGLLSPMQVVVAMVTITLFVPCMASVMMIAKERGWRTASGMVLFIFPLAFLVGGLLNRVLLAFGWGL
jgi:ferrous iron transport protein B